MVATELAGSPNVLGQLSGKVPDACADCPLVTILVCRKCKGSEKVIDYLKANTHGSVETVRCQKVCESPVVGVSIRGRLEWFGKMKGAKQLAALQRLVSAGPPRKVSKRLRKRMSHERSGCRR